MSVSILKRASIWFACLGMVVPQIGVAANNPVGPMDLRLSGSGTLAGQVVDDQGKPVRTDVLVTYGGMVVAKTTTNRSGRFAVSGVRGGVHQIVAGNSSTLTRIWSENTAPASAKSAALLVRGKVVRSQGCGESGCGGCANGSCGTIMGGPVGCGEGCATGGCGGGGFLAGGSGLFGGAGAGTSGLLLSGLVVGGIAAAVAVAADDDDDAPASP